MIQFQISTTDTLSPWSSHPAGTDKLSNIQKIPRFMEPQISLPSTQ